MIRLWENIMMQLSKNVFVRFEHHINNGTLYIYNKKTQKIFKSQEIAYDVLKKLNAYDIAKELENIYSEYTYDEIKYTVENIIRTLKSIGVIENV